MKSCQVLATEIVWSTSLSIIRVSVIVLNHAGIREKPLFGNETDFSVRTPKKFGVSPVLQKGVLRTFRVNWWKSLHFFGNLLLRTRKYSEKILYFSVHPPILLIMAPELSSGFIQYFHMNCRTAWNMQYRSWFRETPVSIYWKSFRKQRSTWAEKQWAMGFSDKIFPFYGHNSYQVPMADCHLAHASVK